MGVSGFIQSQSYFTNTFWKSELLSQRTDVIYAPVGRREKISQTAQSSEKIFTCKFLIVMIPKHFICDIFPCNEKPE